MLGVFLIVGVSTVSFFTQSILLMTNKNHNNQIVQNQIQAKTTEDNFKDLYVRADASKNIFGANANASTSTVTSTSTFTDIDISSNTNNNISNINIPGVSRLGYDSSISESVLTDNINKYGSNTLVLGGIQNNGDMTPGGGDNSLINQYDFASKVIMPNLSSKAYLMADLDTGEIIVDKNSDDIYPIASVSKLMTATIANEKMNLQDVAIVSKDAVNAYGSQGGLVSGEKIRLSDLVYPLIMESSNNAAEVFADYYGHEAFMDEMNKKAESLGMNDTYYNDPSGLDPKNSSTPKDLLKLVRYIWKNDPTVFGTTRVKQFAIKGHTWLNRNPQLSLDGYIGGKNGYIDQALQTTASLFEIPTLKGGTRKVVIIVLKSNDKNGDVIRLINFLKKYVVYTQ
jgi:hypothetical protein